MKKNQVLLVENASQRGYREAPLGDRLTLLRQDFAYSIALFLLIVMLIMFHLGTNSLYSGKLCHGIVVFANNTLIVSFYLSDLALSI